MSEKIINRCKKYNCDYIIRCKEGLASSIAQEYNAISERIKTEITEFANEIIYKDGTVNVLKYTETKVKMEKKSFSSVCS